MHHAYIDRFANLDSPIHRLDARAKIVVVVIYAAVLISVPKYQIASLGPYAILPFALLTIGAIPLGFALKQMVMVSPLVLSLAVLNPIWDSSLRPFAGLWVRGGWLVCGSILIKFVLGMGALVALTGTTRFADLLAGLQKLGLPRVLVTQLGLLYRYLFVLIDQAMHMRQGRDARLGSSARLGRRVRTGGAMVGVLFVRTLEQAERIHCAMQARGYDGTVRVLERRGLGLADVAFLMGSIFYVAALRFGPMLWSG
ncbi:MAG: cobalt ECF transporter T component CbiQ [Phycisphaerae bacterium]